MDQIARPEAFVRDRDGAAPGAPAACRLPAMGLAIADSAARSDAEEHIEAVGRQRFRASNRPRWGEAARDAADDRLRATRQRIARRERQLLRTPESRIVARRGEAAVSRMYPVMGWTMLVVALVLLIPIPLVVAIGIAEGAMTLEALVERPWLAVAYGFAPWGAVAALKLIRHALLCETQRSWLDIGLALATLAAFALWIHTYSATFLADTSAGPDAAFDAAVGMGTFYKTQLLLEATAGYSAWTISERLLSHGMVQEVVPSASHRALLEAQERDLAVAEQQAARLDAIDDAFARHAAAEADFVKTSLGRLADYQNRLQGLSDRASAEARAALRADFTREPEGLPEEVREDA